MCSAFPHARCCERQVTIEGVLCQDRMCSLSEQNVLLQPVESRDSIASLGLLKENTFYSKREHVLFSILKENTFYCNLLRAAAASRALVS